MPLPPTVKYGSASDSNLFGKICVLIVCSPLGMQAGKAAHPSVSLYSGCIAYNYILIIYRSFYRVNSVPGTQHGI